MPRVRKMVIFSLGAVFAAAAFLWGCNGTDINDPDFSDSLLVVQTVKPPVVQSDNLATTTDDTVSIEVKNINRTQGTSSFFGDIFISSAEIICVEDDPTAPMPISPGLSGTAPVSITIPADSTTTIDLVLVPGASKSNPTGSATCILNFNGTDLGGEPVLSTDAVFGVIIF